MTGLPLRLCSSTDLLELQVVQHALLANQVQQRTGNFVGMARISLLLPWLSAPSRLGGQFQFLQAFAMMVVGSCDLLMTSSREIMPFRYLSISSESSVTMPVFGAGLDVRLDAESLVVADQRGDGRRVDHDLKGRHAARLVDARNQQLRNDRLQHGGKLDADGFLLVDRERR